MTLNPLVNPYQPLVGLTGLGLTGGLLYVGLDGQDPETYPQTCYWDAAATIVASQPIPVVGGYPVRLGTPTRLYTADTYSIRLRSQTGAQVFYEAHAAPVFPPVPPVLSPPVELARLGIYATRAAAQAASIDATVHTDGVVLMGYYAAGDGGGARYRYSASAPTTSGGGFQSADGAYWLLSEPEPHVRMFGAKGDGTDDTAALQRAVNYVLTGPIRRMKFPAGTYSINGPLQITGTNVVGLDFAGEHMGTTITQTADNQPIFELLATGVSHKNMFRGFNVLWSTASTTSKTRRAFLLCSNTGNTDFFNNTIENINCDYGDYVIRSEGPSFWGNRVIAIDAGKNMSSGVAYMVPAVTTGQPNNYFERHYIIGNAMAGPVYRGAASDVEMHAIEFNEMNQGPSLLYDPGGGHYTIGKIRLENGHCNTAGRILFDNVNGQTSIDYFEVTGNDMQVNAQTFIFKLANPIARILVRVLNLGVLASSTGKLRIFNGDVDQGRCTVDFIKCAQMGGLITLTDITTTAGANSINVVDWENFVNRRYNADANVTLTWADKPVQIFDTLTANRVLTLPSAYDDQMYAGRPFKIVKEATGFSLAVNNSFGFALFTIPAANKGSIEVRHRRGSVTFELIVETVAVWT